MRLFRSISEPIRENMSFDERANGIDRGHILAWEYGRKLAATNKELHESARRGELPVLVYKGGLTKRLKTENKCGALLYYAAWLGLRREDLDIDLSQRIRLKCTKFGSSVEFSPFMEDYGGQE